MFAPCPRIRFVLSTPRWDQTESYVSCYITAGFAAQSTVSCSLSLDMSLHTLGNVLGCMAQVCNNYNVFHLFGRLALRQLSNCVLTLASLSQDEHQSRTDAASSRRQRVSPTATLPSTCCQDNKSQCSKSDHVLTSRRTPIDKCSSAFPNKTYDGETISSRPYVYS